MAFYPARSPGAARRLFALVVVLVSPSVLANEERSVIPPDIPKLKLTQLGQVRAKGSIEPKDLRASARDGFPPDVKDSDFGFRCRLGVATARAAGAAERKWAAGDVEFTLSAQDFRAVRGGKSAFSARESLEAKMAAYRKSMREDLADPALAGEGDDEDRAAASYEYRPLSVVGTIVSLEEVGATDSPWAARDWRWTRLDARDLARPAEPKSDLPGGAVSLLDFWPEREILRVLLADTYVKKLLPKDAAAPASLDDLWDALAPSPDRPEDPADECKHDVRMDASTLGSFAFHHLKKDKVAVRVFLPAGTEPCRGRYQELGLVLPVPASLSEALARADRLESGYLMESARKVGSPSYSVKADAKDLLGPRNKRK